MNRNYKPVGYHKTGFVQPRHRLVDESLALTMMKLTIQKSFEDMESEKEEMLEFLSKVGSPDGCRKMFEIMEADNHASDIGSSRSKMIHERQQEVALIFITSFFSPLLT